MAYKSLLTVVMDPANSKALVDNAAAFARAHDAHLEVLAVGVDRTQVGYYHAGANALITQETIQRATEDAEEAEAWVKERLSAEDIRWSTALLVVQTTTLTHVISHRARFADLVLLEQPYGAGTTTEDVAVLEAALFEAAVPVLVTPRGKSLDRIPDRPMIAWNESAEALRATRLGVPLLASAASVNIAIIDPPSHGPERSDPGGQLSQMISRHGARVEVSVLAKSMPKVSDVLNRHVKDWNADLVLMGAYGHSRFREAILGGATRNMLEQSEVPVLMAH